MSKNEQTSLIEIITQLIGQLEIQMVKQQDKI